MPLTSKRIDHGSMSSSSESWMGYRHITHSMSRLESHDLHSVLPMEDSVFTAEEMNTLQTTVFLNVTGLVMAA